MIYFWIFLQQSIASLTHIVGKDAAMHTSPALVLLLRSSIAAVILYLITAIMQRDIHLLRSVTKKDFLLLLFLGFLNININQFLYIEGLALTTPANSALLYALTPAIVYVLVLLIHRERTTWKRTVGIIIAFVGVCILIFEHGLSFESAYTKGNIIIFIAVIAWSLFTLLGKPLVEKYGALRTTTLHMFLGALLYIPMGFAFSEGVSFASLDSTLWTEILYLAVFSSCINYVLWYYALGKLETSKVAVFQNLQPVLTTIIALILGTVVLTPELIGGGILTIAGVLVVEYS